MAENRGDLPHQMRDVVEVAVVEEKVLRRVDLVFAPVRHDPVAEEVPL